MFVVRLRSLFLMSDTIYIKFIKITLSSASLNKSKYNFYLQLYPSLALLHRVQQRLS